MLAFCGTQITPPETAVVPPTSDDFSRTITRAPASCAASAAVKPAPPVPRITTSVSCVKALFVCDGDEAMTISCGAGRLDFDGKLELADDRVGVAAHGRELLLERHVVGL